MKFKYGDWVQMGGCIIEVIEDNDRDNPTDIRGEVVRITDESTAEECGVHIGLVDDWEVINKEPLDYEEKMFWKLDN
jgi:hypothetical protein